VPKSIDNQVAFNGGEFSPLLDARVDQPKYRNACRQLQNMIALKQGGATRRPGTQFIAAAKLTPTSDHNYSVNLIEFQFSPTTSFALEFGHQYVRFYSNGVQVTLDSAGVWSTLNAYAQGAFVEDSADSNNFYYCIVSVTSGGSAPHLDATHWVKQSIYEVPSPYSGDPGSDPWWKSDVMALQYCEINDVVYLTHPSYPVYKLTRFSDTSWTLVPLVALTPPLLDQNITNTTIAASSLTGSVTLTATAPAWATTTYYEEGNTVLESGLIYECLFPHISGTFATDLAAGDWGLITIFSSGHVGSYWELAYLNSSSYVEFDITGAGTSDVLKTLGSWEVHTYGVWSADVAVQRSLDNGQTWDTVRSFAGRSDRNVDLQGTASQLATYRMVVSNYSDPTNPGATTPRVVFESVDGFIDGIVKVTAVGGAYSATATVITQLNATSPTQYWSEGAWSAVRGYPTTVTSFQQRVVYGGTAFEPQRIWGTQTGDLENFDLGDQTLATQAFAFDLNAPSRGPIQWITSQSDLFVGFSGAEWIVNSGSTAQNGASGAAIGPTAINAVEHSAWGSCPGVKPQVVGNAVLYTQRQAQTIQQMLFSVYTNKYMSSDMTSLSDHLFAPGIVKMAYQPQFRNQGILWVINKAGALCGMTYQLEQEVFGWHRHVTGAILNETGDSQDVFESMCVVQGKNPSNFVVNDDEVWVVVHRTVNSVSVRYIERVNPTNWEIGIGADHGVSLPDAAGAIYVDCAKTYTSVMSSTITGLSHLEGKNVYGNVNGGFSFGPLSVVGGSVTIPNLDETLTSPVTVQIGLAEEYFIQPMRLDIDPRIGPTQGTKKAITDVYVRVVNSQGGSVSNGKDGLVPIPYRDNTVELGTPTPLFTGEKKVEPINDLAYDPKYIITGFDALPLTLLALILRYDITSSP
jgi:hypothetical protein